MKDQLIRLMESENMSPAKFADEIGVQRSSISHILSDRNKPSYDFIIKVLHRFPGLNAEWLITGTGNMIKSANIIPKEVKQTTIFDQISTDHDKIQTKPLNYTSESSVNIDSNIRKPEILIEKNEEKKDVNIEKTNQFTNVTNSDFVIIFYKDGTFERFNSR